MSLTAPTFKGQSVIVSSTWFPYLLRLRYGWNISDFFCTCDFGSINTCMILFFLNDLSTEQSMTAKQSIFYLIVDLLFFKCFVCVLCDILN